MSFYAIMIARWRDKRVSWLDDNVTLNEDYKMFISPAYAQAGSGGFGGGLVQLLPFILIFVVFYLLLIRPQQKRQKEHRLLVENLKKGDFVVTAGGITGKVTKAVDGNEMIEVEIASGIVTSVIRHMVSEVRDREGRPLRYDPQAASKKGK